MGMASTVFIFFVAFLSAALLPSRPSSQSRIAPGGRGVAVSLNGPLRDDAACRRGRLKNPDELGDSHDQSVAFGEMSSTGPAIFDDDLACDVRDSYRKLLEERVADDEATRRSIEDWAEFGFDEESVFWLALAAAQSQLGRLHQNVRQRALEVIDSDKTSSVGAPPPGSPPTAPPFWTRPSANSSSGRSPTEDGSPALARSHGSRGRHGAGLDSEQRTSPCSGWCSGSRTASTTRSAQFSNDSPGRDPRSPQPTCWPSCLRLGRRGPASSGHRRPAGTGHLHPAEVQAAPSGLG